jgi:hypothetical protein
MTKIITIHNRLDWVYYVSKAAEHDFYHTWHYHSLDTSGSPILFIYESGANFIGIPFLKRPIPGSAYCDFTCVYGYTGPIANKKMELIEADFIEGFQSAFLRFLADEHCVSVFSRMHPFYPQHLVLQNFGGIYDNGLTVAVDFSISMDEQRKNYRDSVLHSIKQAWKKEYVVKEENGPEAVATFVEIYTENMRRVSASSYYMFDAAKISALLNTKEYDARILMIYDGDTVICSTILTFTNGIIQAYLIGTRTDYLHNSPSKFLVDEISLIGRSLGMKYYNLGGGLGFKNDSLFAWKAAFSNFHLPYKSWRFIANPTVYQQLLDEKGIDKNAEIDFFPLYRLV